MASKIGDNPEGHFAAKGEQPGAPRVTQEGDVVIPPSAQEDALSSVSAPSESSLGHDDLGGPSRNGGNLSWPSYYDFLATSTELRIDRDRRRMRIVAFVYFMVVSAFFFCILGRVFSSLMSNVGTIPAIIGAVDKAGGHWVYFLGLIVVLMATVPISLAFGLIRLSAEREELKSADGASSGVTTPQIQAAKELVKTASDLLKR